MKSQTVLMFWFRLRLTLPFHDTVELPVMKAMALAQGHEVKDNVIADVLDSPESDIVI